MHRDPEDGLLYVTKQVVVDKDNNGRVLYNDPIMIRDIEEMLILYKDQMVNMAKRLLKPKVYEDTRHKLENI